MKQCAIWELLAPLEWVRLSSQLTDLWYNTPKGDGHKVIVLPGFCAGSHSTRILRLMLNDQNYDAIDWGMGMNLGPSDALNDALMRLVYEADEPVSLIGWSLGGIYARIMANTHPEKVRRVITLGTPHRDNPKEGVLRTLYELISPKKLSELTEEDYALIRNDPPVPLTSIYTKQDGVVDWRDCVCDAENVEVRGTHMGLTHNPDVIRAIFERLPQI